MRKFFVLFFLFSIINFLSGQSVKWMEYLTLKDLAESKYIQKDFLNAEIYYSKMDSLYHGMVEFKDLYSYIICLLQNRQISKAETYAFLLVNSKCFSVSFFEDTIFNALKSRKNWSRLDSLSMIFGIKCQEYIDSLDIMAEEDVSIRNLFVNTETREERDSVRLLMREIDARNTTKLKGLIEKYGFPSWELLGEEGLRKAWLIAQHADFEFQDYFIIEYEKAVKNSNAHRPYLAYLIDRSLIRKKKPQIYATQTNSKSFFHPIENIDQLNYRREEMFMRPINIQSLKVND